MLEPVLGPGAGLHGVRAPGLDALASRRAAVDRRLAALLPSHEGLPLLRAMRETVLAPGKRIRPLLTVLAAADLGARDGMMDAALDAACAVEMVHTASLVLDDLPSMDDATLRRGRPAAHLEYGEDTAILAAVGLLSQAFGVLAAVPGLGGPGPGRLVAALARAVGPEGLVRGQYEDLRPSHGNLAGRPARDIAAANHRKTGSLFVAAVEIGGVIAGASEARLSALQGFATELGQAFQLLDDLLDREATELALGKDVGQDADKATLVTVLGRPRARERLDRHLSAALDRLPPGCTGLSGFVGALFSSERAEA